MGVGQQLAQQLQMQGHTCSLIEASKSFQIIDQQHYLINPANPQEIKQAVGTALATVRTLPLHGVIHLWSLDTTPIAAINTTTLETDQILGVQSALSLIQALIEESVQTRLWLVTQGAQPVSSETGAESTHPQDRREAPSQPIHSPDPYGGLAVVQSPIWGLGKSCAMEHPEIWGGLIDLDPHTIGGEGIISLPSLLQGDLREDQIALRGTKTYVARMIRYPIQEQRALHLSPDAAYLITGGLWGLGLEIARWLTTQGARHLVLLGRSKLPPRETWEQVQPESRQGIQIAGIRSLEQLGAQVHYASIDVADSAQLATFLHHYQQQENPPIRGIIHAASVWQDAQGQSLVRPLISLSPADLVTVLRPKMLGGWLLAKLFQETPLDFFVSFSSGASLFGSAAQGNYAAASEFLDVLAYYQRAHGQPAISIDWGAISEIGFGATPEGLRVHEYWESHGIQRISPKQVLAALELLIPQDLTRVGVLKLDWQLIGEFYPQITDLPLVSQLVEDSQRRQGRVPTGEDGVGTGQVLQTLRDAAIESAERRALLTTYVQEQITHVLHIPPHRLDTEQPLTALGLDSLMAIELKNRIELDLRIRIPIITFLQGPSIAQFVNQVLTELEGEFVEIGEGAEYAIGTEQAQDTSQRRQGPAPVALPQEPAVPALVGTQVVSEAAKPPNNQRVGASSVSTDIEQQKAAQLLAQLDQLSDQDVDSLLSQMLVKEEE
jgi:NAD(P)-dependent dehydrogenase (short-subunit alcohol dehydrogenase family)/acyl carrier protein